MGSSVLAVISHPHAGARSRPGPAAKVRISPGPSTRNRQGRHIGQPAPGRRPRTPHPGRRVLGWTERFVAAVVGGDLTALVRTLAPDVTLWSDGGGKAVAARAPVHGRNKVARAIIGGEHRHPIPDLEIRYRRINGEPAVLLMSGRRPRMLVLLDLVPDDERARGVYVVTNPDKLFRLR
jgi:hypothetical protein